MRDAVEALVTALRAEGAASPPAPWGGRVSIAAASSVVELAGAPSPKRLVWPCLQLFGPEVVEDRTVRAPHARERLSEDRDAGTMVVQPWPRSYALRFEVVVQSRVGSTAADQTAFWELLAMVERFEQWLARTPKLAGANLFSRAPLSRRSARPTPADIQEARGAIELASVFVHAAPAATVDTTLDIAARVRPERPGG